MEPKQKNISAESVDDTKNPETAEVVPATPVSGTVNVILDQDQVSDENNQSAAAIQQTPRDHLTPQQKGRL